MRVGGFLAVATANPSIEVIDLSCMKLHGALKGHIMAVSALASLEGQNRLVSGSHDTFVRRVHFHVVSNPTISTQQEDHAGSRFVYCIKIM